MSTGSRWTWREVRDLTVAAAVGLVVLLAAVVLMILFRVGVWMLGDRYPAPTTAGLLLVLTSPFTIGLINRERARRAVDRHAGRAGWTALDPRGPDWPWTGLLLRGKVEVRRAWSVPAVGPPITAGEIRWSGNALAGAAGRTDGKGTFVVLHLPAAAPAMAMRLPYEFVGEAPVLNSPALRQAHLTGEIPPWTVRGDELFTIEPHDGWIRPKDIDEAVRRTLRVAHLLELPGAE